MSTKNLGQANQDQQFNMRERERERERGKQYYAKTSQTLMVDIFSKEVAFIPSIWVEAS